LLGGAYWEPVEENPMLGLRGASRYYHPSYAPAFILECHALNYVRNVMGLTNVNVMVPFVRTVEEGAKVKEILRSQGLISGREGLQIFMMCELPSNVILLDSFAHVFDGFSIGSNDLTQTVLAVDRDSGLLTTLFREDNPAVMYMIKEAIIKAHNSGKKIGICGQGPSDNRAFAQYVIENGIDSISLNADTVVSFIQNSHLVQKITYVSQANL
jgi:pyruvate,water dikinase